MKKVPLSNNGQSEWLKVDWGTYESIITSTDFNNLPKNRTKNATVTGRYSSHDEAQADFVKKDYKRADESMHDYFIRVYGQKTGQKIYSEWTIRQTSKNIDPRKDHISKIKDWWGRVRTKTKIEVKDTANIQRWYLFPPKQSRVYGPEVAPETPMWVKMNRYTLHRLQDLDRYMFTRDPYHANIPIEEVELNKAGEVVSYKVRGKKVDLSKVSDKNLKAIANSDLIRGPKNKIESINMQDQWTRIQRVVFDKKDKSGDQWRKRISIFERIQSAQWASRQQISWTRAYRQNYTKNILREWAADPNKLEDYWASLFSKNQLHSMRTPYEKARAQYNMEGGFYRSNDYYRMIVHDDISKESKRRIAKSYMAAHLSMELGFKVSPKAISTKQADDELRKNNPGLQADIDIEKQAIRYNLNHIERTRDIALVNTLALHPLQRAKDLDKNIDYSQYRSGNAPYKQFFQEAPKGFHVPKAMSRRDITFSEFRMARDLFVKERSKELIKEYTGEAKAQRAQESIKLFEDKIKDLEKQREARLEGLRLTIKSRKGDVNKISQLVEDDDTLKTIARKLTMAQKDLDEARATVEELRARVRPERKGDYTRAKFGAEDDWKKELKYSKQHGGSLGRLPNLVKSTITGTKNYSRPIVVYDVETGPAEEILSVSAAKFVIDKKTNKLVKVDTFNRFYYPIKEGASAWNSEAIRVNGLTPDVIKAYRKNDHAKYSERYDAGEMNALLKFIGDGSVLVGQNSHDFDNMRAFGGHLPGIDTVDTMDVARGFRGTTTGDVDEWKIHNDLETLVRWADWERTKRYSKYGGKGRTMEELGFSHHLSEHDIVATAFVFETMVNMKNEAGNALRFVLNNPGHNFGPYDSMVKSLIYKGAYKRTPEPGSYIDRRFYNMKTSDNDIGGPIDILPDMDMNDENTQVFDVDAQGNRVTDSFQKTGLSEKALDKAAMSIGTGLTDSEKVAEALSNNIHEARLIEAMETFTNLVNDYFGSIQATKSGSSTEADSAVKFAQQAKKLSMQGYLESTPSLIAHTIRSMYPKGPVFSNYTESDYNNLYKTNPGIKFYVDSTLNGHISDVNALMGMDELQQNVFSGIMMKGAKSGERISGSIIGKRFEEFQELQHKADENYYNNFAKDITPTHIYHFLRDIKAAGRKAGYNKVAHTLKKNQHKNLVYDVTKREYRPPVFSDEGSLQERFNAKYNDNSDFRNRVDEARRKRTMTEVPLYTFFDIYNDDERIQYDDQLAPFGLGENPVISGQKYNNWLKLNANENYRKKQIADMKSLFGPGIPVENMSVEDMEKFRNEALAKRAARARNATIKEWSKSVDNSKTLRERSVTPDYLDRFSVLIKEKEQKEFSDKMKKEDEEVAKSQRSFAQKQSIDRFITEINAAPSLGENTKANELEARAAAFYEAHPVTKHIKPGETNTKEINDLISSTFSSTTEPAVKAMKELAESADNVSDKFGTLTNTIADFTPGKSQFYDPRITSEAAERGYMGAMGAADFLPRSFQKNLQRLGDAGFRQLQIRQSGFGTWLDIAHSSGIGMQNSMKRVGGFAGGKIGESVGGLPGKKQGKESGENIGSALGWSINFGSQIRGRLEKRFVENQFARMQSTFDLMSLAKDYLIAPFKLISAAVKSLTGLFKNLGVSIVNFMNGALKSMGSLGTPLTTMTGIGYSQYQGLGALDSLFGFSKGTLNSSFESTSQQAQLLYSTGQFNQERLIASARLGVFNETYGRNASFENIVNGLMSKPVTKERMALAGQIDANLPTIMETMKALGISTWDEYKNPALQGIGWHPLNDEERLAMRKSYYEYSAIQENIGNTKMRAGQWLWSKGGEAIMNGANEALDLIVSKGDWKGAWEKLKAPIMDAWGRIKTYFGVAFSDNDTLWTKIKKFGAAVWDKLSEAINPDQEGGKKKGFVDTMKDMFASIIEAIFPTMVKGIIMIENLWTAAFQSIVTSVAPILDNFFDHMSRMRIDPLALVYQSTLGKDDFFSEGIRKLLGNNHTEFISFATEEDKYNANIKNKKSQLSYYDQMSESSKAAVVSPYFEPYSGAPGSGIGYEWTKMDFQDKKAFVFANSVMPSDTELVSPNNDSKGYFLSSDEYARSAFYDVYKNVQAAYGVGKEGLTYTLADGRGHNWQIPAVKGESVEQAFERAQLSGSIQAMTEEVSGKSHLFSEQILPGVVEATNFINDSVLPELLQEIVTLLQKGFGISIDVTNNFDKNGKPTGTKVSAADDNGNDMKDTVQSVQVDRVYVPF